MVGYHIFRRRSTQTEAKRLKQSGFFRAIGEPNRSGLMVILHTLIQRGEWDKGQLLTLATDLSTGQKANQQAEQTQNYRFPTGAVSSEQEKRTGQFQDDADHDEEMGQ
jgi:hypothetical protein